MTTEMTMKMNFKYKHFPAENYFKYKHFPTENYFLM